MAAHKQPSGLFDDLGQGEAGSYDSVASPASHTRRRTSHRRPRAAKIGTLHVWTLKERVQAFLDGTAGIAFETLNVVLSMVLVITTVVDSYRNVELNEESLAYSYFELGATLFFALDYALHLYAAQDRLRFMVTPIGIIDLVTIIPALLTFFLTTLSLNGVLPLLRVARVFRMLAVLRLYRIVQSYRGYDYQLGVLIFLILALIFVAAGVFQILEESYYTEQGLDPLEFHQAMYFVFVTISTVGYGDISPQTTEGQLFVILIIVVIVTVIPRQVTRLMELSSLQHSYMHSYSLRRRSVHNGGHVVVTGHVRLESVSEFLKEFYRPRQGRVNMDVVFLADHVPSDSLQALLINVRYRRRTTYLKGNLLNDKDAKRAHVAQAAAVFILAAKNDPRRAEATDALSVLMALAIDKFRFRANLEQQKSEERSQEGLHHAALAGERQLRRKVKQPRPIRCFMEILSPQPTRGLRTITGVEVALNTPRLRTAILARSILCPGATALLLNLIYSPTERHVVQGRRSHTPWVAEYAGGLQHLLFPAMLPAYFDGMLFEHAAEKLYLHFQVMVIALYDRSSARHGGRRIRLSPFGEKLEENDLVFLIAPSASEAKHAVDSLGECDREFDHEQNASSTSRGLHIPFTAAITAPTVNAGVGGTPPVLVFSSETVLDRQSDDRRPSLDLEDEAEAAGDSSLSPSLVSVSEDDVCEEVEQECPTTSALASHIAPSTASTTASSPTLSLPAFQLAGTSQRPSIGQLRRESSTLAVGERRRLRGHILICGPFTQAHQLACYLDDLYTRERGSAEGERPPVVLLVKTVPRDKEFANLPRALPAGVFVERGASQNVEDLLRVRAYEAESVLLVPGSWEGAVDESSEVVDEHLLDYQVIMSTLSLRTMQGLHQEHLQQQQQQFQTASSDNSRLTKVTVAPTAPTQPPTLGCSVVRSHESIKYFAYKSHTGLQGLDDVHGDHSEDEGIAPGFRDLSENPHDEYHDDTHALHDSEHSGHSHRRYSPLGLLGRKLAAERRRRRARAEAERLLPPAFAPAYAAGEVFVDSILDTLLCQSFFNPYAVDLVRALAGDYYPISTGSRHGGHIGASGRLDKHGSPPEDPRTFRASMMRYFSSPNMVEDAVKGGEETASLPSKAGEADHGRPYPALRVATLASELEGESFAEVFVRGLAQEVLVLGVYRRARAGGRGNARPYVVTCPESPEGCRVEHGDQLHVLTKRPGPVRIR